MMSPHSESIGHLERSAGNDRLRRALSARLDRALKRAGISSASAARRFDVSEHEVQFWRRGITVPPLRVFTGIAAILDLDVHWLCTGKMPDDPAAI